MRLSPAAVMVLLCLGASPVALASKLELELGAGSTYGVAESPAVTGRIGADFLDHFTLSFRVLGLGSARESGLQGSIDTVSQGPTGWAAMAEARAHTSGAFQLSIGGGVGLGQLPAWACSSASCSGVSPYEQASVGARLFLGDLFVSADASLQLWNAMPGIVASGAYALQNPSRLGGALLVGVGGRTAFF